MAERFSLGVCNPISAELSLNASPSLRRMGLPCGETLVSTTGLYVEGASRPCRSRGHGHHES